MGSYQSYRRLFGDDEAFVMCVRDIESACAEAWNVKLNRREGE